jgi:glycosyltransferase involved in cell wall biosynthesis
MRSDRVAIARDRHQPVPDRTRRAALPGECLASARAAVDEIVLVDTGSRDATKAIAAAAGARVIDFTWCDDFAAARNAGLEQARGTHVLVLDADERLAQGAAPVLRAAARDKGLLIGMLPLHDADALDARARRTCSRARAA